LRSVSASLNQPLDKPYLWNVKVFARLAGFVVGFINVHASLTSNLFQCLVTPRRNLRHIILRHGVKRRAAADAAFFKSSFLLGLYFNIPVAGLNIIAAHAFLYYQSYRAAELQQVLLKSQLAQAQLQTLKMQIHPHFLFKYPTLVFGPALVLCRAGIRTERKIRAARRSA
jgi:hypothetical protein